MARIAIIGNPNVGKTTLFNSLTQSKQKTGNYPGITVNSHAKSIQIKGEEHIIYDLPGCYSLYPSSKDEEVVFDVLTQPHHQDKPDQLLIVIEPSNIKRSLLFVEQVTQLNYPCLLVINEIDSVTKTGVKIDFQALEKQLGLPVLNRNAQKKKDINKLINQLNTSFVSPKKAPFSIPPAFIKIVAEVREKLNLNTDYLAWSYLVNSPNNLSLTEKEILIAIRKKEEIIPKRLQVQETLVHYKKIDKIIEQSVTFLPIQKNKLSEKIDKVATHPFWGYVLLFSILLLVFQTIYSWAALPMDLIDNSFAQLSSFLENQLPSGALTDLLVEGIIPGLGGVFIFIPQIALLFFFLYLMEESGYMSRVVFLMDRWLRPYGMNGKSVVPLLSAVACAIPAIMGARTIENRRNRIITIFTAPLITCAARLPVYAIIIALVIPDEKWGIFNLQGLSLFFLYVLGVVAALLTGMLMRGFIKNKHACNLIIEMPRYRFPSLITVFKSIAGKIKDFIFNAGKMILSVSIVLWVLGSYGMGDDFENAADIMAEKHPEAMAEELERETASYQLEHSYLGQLGKLIEPAIAPLGYDWKMGIGLVASFAAREVFVSSMASIYSINGDKGDTLKEKMRKERNALTGEPSYTLASGWSLLIFYAFAMQCMSTVAVTKRETNWKWALAQLVFMNVLAYVSALVVYQTLA